MRGKRAPKRIIEPDKIYGNVIVTKFINRVMKDGKKTVAEKVVYNAFELLKSQGKDPMEVFAKAIETVSPKVEIKARRIGGANYQVPVEVRGERKVAVAIKWILEAAEARPNKEFHTFSEKLVAEFMAILAGQGSAIQKRDNTHKQAEANKAFAHFRF
ncbi:MAG TPA: 30S ribosomal protein S7 [Patescibacteria group bacterium]|nr:30S ribosomal protein S7 [Patescibacteria group bacterium]